MPELKLESPFRKLIANYGNSQNLPILLKAWFSPFVGIFFYLLSGSLNNSFYYSPIDMEATSFDHLGM